MFNDKSILVTGGTGSFGRNFVKNLLNRYSPKKIIVFSRDELKQFEMQQQFSHDCIRYFIGDVRDRDRLIMAMRGVDYVIHAAALKQVPSCEFHPMEAVKTNIIGTDNVLTAAINANVKKVIVLSTDKAVYPINAMGVSKAMMERVAVAKTRNLGENDTTICCTRYGNVMASRGSVIPLFMDQIREGKEITITDPAMTRFMMTLDQAVELVLFAFENGHGGDIFVQKAPAATVELLAKTLSKLLGRPNHKINIIGTRHGEKLYEALLTREEMVSAEDMGDYYRIPADTRDLNYSKYFDEGESVITQAHEYHSHNTKQLTQDELRNMLLGLHEIQDDLKEFSKGNAK